MATIFTRAKAAKKVIALIGHECCIPRSKLRCDARLESDLGIIGDDTWALLEAMHAAGVDMTQFDCEDRITPEGQDPIQMLIIFGIFMVCVFALVGCFPELSPWVIVPASVVVSHLVHVWLNRFRPDGRHEELRVKDLVLSFEAGHWISPKAGNGGDGKASPVIA